MTSPNQINYVKNLIIELRLHGKGLFYYVPREIHLSGQYLIQRCYLHPIDYQS